MENITEKNDDRLDRILEMLVKFTQGDFEAREKISEKGDEIDAIILGLNTLGEELSSTNFKKD